MSRSRRGGGLKESAETGVCRGGVVFRDGAAGGRNFPNRQDRFAAASVKHIDVALLCRSNNCRNGRSILACQIEKSRLGWYIHVPKIVMNCLANPANGAGLDIEGHDRGGVFLDTFAPPHAKLVGNLVAQRDVNEASAGSALRTDQLLGELVV